MRPGPPLYAPPPAPVSTNPPGYTVTLSGDPDRILTQLRLLPLSRNILLLPALTFTAPIASRRHSTLGPRNRASTASEHPTDIQLKASILRLHRDFLRRQDAAREFLSRPRGLLDGERRVVFFNGGTRDLKAMCLKGLRDVVGDEEEVERLWEEVVQEGVEGLVEAVEGKGTDLLSLNIDVAIPCSMISPISPNMVVGKNDDMRDGAEEMTGHGKLETSEDEEEPETRTVRLDSTYSSGMESIPTPPASAEIRDPEFRLQAELLADSDPEKCIDCEGQQVEELFAGEEENLELHLVPEKFDTRRKFPDRLLSEPIFNTHRISRKSSWGTLTRPRSSVRQVFKIHIPADKSPLEVQNEIRLHLSRYLPPVNTAETPTQAEFPEATRWLLDPETDIFSPLLSSGNEGLPESLCPSFDLIAAVGADGREMKDSLISEDTDRQASRLAGTLGSELGNLGNRGAADTRGARISLKFLVRSILPYLPNLPGTSLDDIAAGYHLLPALEACLKDTPQVRLLLLEFDLRTGSQAVLHLKSILPRSMFRLIVIGEQAPSTAHNHGGRIYVRQSIGKTTLSFSSLPSPIAREPRKQRRFEASRTSAMARADVIMSPWTEPGAAAYISTVDLVRDGIRGRRIECGVIADSLPPVAASFPQTAPPVIRAPRAVSPRRSPSPRESPSLHPPESRRPSVATSTSSYSRDEREAYIPLPHPGREFFVSHAEVVHPEWGDWNSSYLEEAVAGESESEDDDDRERERCRSRMAGRKGSKALRWLGIEGA